MLTVTKAVRSLLSRIREDGTQEHAAGQMVSFQDFLQVVGLSEIRELEKRFASPSHDGRVTFSNS